MLETVEMEAGLEVYTKSCCGSCSTSKGQEVPSGKHMFVNLMSYVSEGTGPSLQTSSRPDLLESEQCEPKQTKHRNTTK